jgi:hypothetical protein
MVRAGSGRPGPSGAGQPNMRGHAGGKTARRADRTGPLSAEAGAEPVRRDRDRPIKLRSTVPRHLLPPVMLDRGETLARVREGRQLTSGLSPATKGRLGDAADDGKLGEVRDVDQDAEMQICVPVMRKLSSVLLGVCVWASLGQSKGMVRWLRLRTVQARRSRGNRRSRMVAFHPSSPQTKPRIFSSPYCCSARGWSLSIGRVRWWCGRGMRVQRGGAARCGPIFRGELEYVSLGHVGAREVFWLVEGGGGGDERGPGRWLLRPGSERGSGEGCCKVFH